MCLIGFFDMSAKAFMADEEFDAGTSPRRKLNFMKIIILAAGIGLRLQRGIPKALVHIDKERTILDIQLEELRKWWNLSDVLIVVGYKRELILEKYPRLNYVFNNAFDKTNTAKSLLLALQQYHAQDVLWMNGDVVFSPAVLRKVRERMAHNFVCVNQKKIGTEEIAYTLDKKGVICQLAKKITGGLGEAIGINFVTRANFGLFRQSLVACTDSDYFERAIEISRDKGVFFRPLNLKNNFCTEIDFKKDLAVAEKHFKFNS